MRLPFKKPVYLLFSALILASGSLPTISRAQTYPIDCAILLCLAGGWPASVPCERARVEFIRRITPWPVEPPLQIWRCPMGVSHETVPPSSRANRIFEASVQAKGEGPRQSFPTSGVLSAIGALPHVSDARTELGAVDQALRLVQDWADIDISGPEFNFVRSIRVFDVRFVRQKESDNTGDCNRGERVLLGTYGIQGIFAWHASSTSALPAAHSGLEGYGEHCPELYHRSVFVEWRDYAGRYGFEQVNY